MNKLKEILILFFITKASAHIVKYCRPASSPILNDIMGEIMRLCYFDLKYIIIFSDNDSYVENHVKYVQPVVILLQNHSANSIPKFIHKHPIDIMIVDLHSLQQLQNILIVDTNPRRWSQSTSLFIIDKTSNNCKNVHDIFKATWNITILVAFFLCLDSNQKSTLFTYNPYANRAPKNWKRVEDINKRSWSNKTWTLYQRFYNPEDICEGLHFDRTSVLDEATISIAAKIINENHHLPLNLPYNESYIEDLSYPDIHVAKAMKYAMNASLIFRYNLHILQEGPDVYKRLKNGSFDIILSSHDTTEGRKYTTTYPIEYVEYYIFTNDQGHYTMLERLCSCYIAKIILIIIFISSVTSIVIILFKTDETIISTIFEAYKLAVNVPLRIEINTSGLKIFFSLIFIYFLVFNINFNGNFMLHFINLEIKKNAEVLEDLEDPKFNTIYVNNDLQSLFKNSSLKNKVILGTPYCEEQIKNSRSVACLDKIDVFSKPVVSKELHIAQNSVDSDYYVYLIRKNWPLKERFDNLMMWIQQSGLARLWYRQLDLRRAINMHRFTEKMIQKFRITTLADLKFLLIILIVGWTFAIISFALEKLL